MYFLSHKFNVEEFENFKININKFSSKKYRDLDYASLKTDNRKYLKFYQKETNNNFYFTRIQSKSSVYFFPKFIFRISKNDLNKVNVRFDRLTSFIMIILLILNMVAISSILFEYNSIISKVIWSISFIYVIFSIKEYFHSLNLLKNFSGQTVKNSK